MKFLHLADLHIGKRYNEFSLIEDQKYILDEVLKIVSDEQPDGVIIAGDVYDKSVPSAEAVELFDRFLNALSEKGAQVFVISGNHDSAERIAFGAKLMSRSGVHFSPVYAGEITPVTLHDNFGEVNIYLLPFIKPATVRRFFEGEKIESYNDALKAAVDAMKIDTRARNVLVAHQFVTGASHSGSEEFIVGDLGNVDAEIFAPFDYTALGHVHGAQNVGSERVRYSGTPLKYSLSEAKSEKSVTIVELKAKGDIAVRTAALKPLRAVVEIRGTYEELTKKSFYEGTTLTKDLVHVVLTDEDDVPDVLAKLRLIYPYIMNVRYDNTRTQNSSQAGELEAVPARSPMELFSALFEAQNNKPMSPEQSELVQSLIEKIWGDER